MKIYNTAADWKSRRLQIKKKVFRRKSRYELIFKAVFAINQVECSS